MNMEDLIRSSRQSEGESTPLLPQKEGVDDSESLESKAQESFSSTVKETQALLSEAKERIRKTLEQIESLRLSRSASK